MKKKYFIQQTGRTQRLLFSSGFCLLLAAPGLVQAQLPQYSLPFNGTNQYAGVPNNPALEFTTGTIEMWVKPNWTVGTHNGANLCLISERSGATINGGTRFSLHMDNNMQAIGIWNGGSYLTVPYSFTKGVWYHIAAVMTTSATQFYVNGALIGTTANGINTSRAGYNLKIGVSETEGTQIGNNEYFEGEIDEVRVWSTARTAAQIQANRNAAISAASPGLVAYYPIDQDILGSANAVTRLLKDYTASSLNGTLYSYFAEVAPTISGLLPARNAVNVMRNGDLGVTFSQNMNSATASDAAIKVFGSQTGKRTGTFSGGGTNTITFNPTQDLKPGETASVTITTAAKGMNNLTLAKPQVYQVTGATAPASGKFGTATPYQAGNFAIQVASGDINGDGNLDLLATNYSGATLNVYLGTGTGSLGSPMTFTGLSNNYSIALGDINNDGRLDVALSSSSNSAVVLLNTGTTALFGAASPVAVGANSERLALGDVNNDGNLDLVVAQNSNAAGNTLRILLGTGTGSFGTPTPYTTGLGPFSVTLSDFNNDGYLDILTPDYGTASVSVLLNAGNGTFGAVTSYATKGINMRRAVAADFNNDGNLDVAVAGSVLLGKGTGSFETKIDLPINGAPDLTVGDVNGDGNQDLVTPNAVLLGNGQGNFSTANDLSVSAFGVALADFNNDGRLDLATANGGANTVSLLLGLAAPTLSNFTPSNGPVGTSVIITGANLSDATAVRFNGRAATSFTVNSATQITAVVPSGATTGTIAVTTPAGTATSTQVFTVTVVADLVVSNTQYVSGTYRNVTITGTGNAILENSLNVTGALTVQNGGTLNVKGNVVTGNSFELQAGATLAIGGREGIAASGSTGGIQTTTRTFSSEANYIYGSYQPGAVTGSGLPAQVRSLAVVDLYGDNETYLSLTNDLAIAQTLQLDYDLTTNGKNLTLLSNAAGTALVVNNGGVVNGTATVQRYIDGSLNPTAGYRHLTAPISNSTVADLATPGFSPTVNAVYNTSVTPGLTTPYPTIFGYDEQRLATSPATGLGAFDKGWFSPADLSSALQVGKGYTVNLGAGQTLDFVGTLNEGRQEFSLTRGNDNEGGWNLIGNPYPSPLDWSQVPEEPGVESAMYVYQSTSQYGGQYRSYVNGIGNPLIALGQGFFVRTSPGTSTATLVLSNKARVTNFAAQPALQRTTSTRPLAHLTLSRTGNPLMDETYVYFQTGATAEADAHFDALKIQHNSGGAPSLYSLAAAKELAINGLPELTTSTLVPLGIDVPQAGTYTLEAAELLNLSTASVYLLDNVTGQQVNLAQQPRYTFTVGAATQTNTRFALRFGTSAVLASKTSVEAGVSLYPNPAHHSVTVSVPAEAGSTSFSAELYNSVGQAVRQQRAALPSTGAHVAFDVTGLPPGVYTMRLLVGQRVITKPLVVN